jgi:uncharacterized membrane protein YphA (DoxX/SURF4 family)
MTIAQKIISWIAAGISALIMLQTLYFKFSAAPESVFIFSSLGLEPVGRIGIGIMELIASVFLIIPKTKLIGALLAVGIMAGALFSHVTKLGISVMNDGGYLFALCLIVLVASLICVLIEKDKLLALLKKTKVK